MTLSALPSAADTLMTPLSTERPRPAAGQKVVLVSRVGQPSDVEIMPVASPASLIACAKPAAAVMAVIVPFR